MGDMVELAKACEFKINKLKEADPAKPSAVADSQSKSQVKSNKKPMKSAEK